MAVRTVEIHQPFVQSLPEWVESDDEDQVALLVELTEHVELVESRWSDSKLSVGAVAFESGSPRAPTPHAYTGGVGVLCNRGSVTVALAWMAEGRDVA